MHQETTKSDPKTHNSGLNHPKLLTLRILGKIWGMFKLGSVSASYSGPNLNIPQILTLPKFPNLEILQDFVWAMNLPLNWACQGTKIPQKDVWE